MFLWDALGMLQSMTLKSVTVNFKNIELFRGRVVKLSCSPSVALRTHQMC